MFISFRTVADTAGPTGKAPQIPHVDAEAEEKIPVARLSPVQLIDASAVEPSSMWSGHIFSDDWAPEALSDISDDDSDDDDFEIGTNESSDANVCDVGFNKDLTDKLNEISLSRERAANIPFSEQRPPDEYKFPTDLAPDDPSLPAAFCTAKNNFTHLQAIASRKASADNGEFWSKWAELQDGLSEHQAIVVMGDLWHDISQLQAIPQEDVNLRRPAVSESWQVYSPADWAKIMLAWKMRLSLVTDFSM